MASIPSEAEIAEIKWQIEEKLAQERAKASFMRETLSQTEASISHMDNVLASFAQRLEQLENTIRPVHGETTNLTRARENIHSVLEQLEDVEEFYSTCANTTKLIKDGPSALQRYLDAMVRIQRAIKYFQVHNPRHPEMQKLATLQSAGFKELEADFDKVVRKESSARNLEEILDWNMHFDSAVEGGEDAMLQEDLLVMPPKRVKRLQATSCWLADHDRTRSVVESYEDVRSHIANLSLTPFLEITNSQPNASMRASTSEESLRARRDSIRVSVLKTTGNILRKATDIASATNSPANARALQRQQAAEAENALVKLTNFSEASLPSTHSEGVHGYLLFARCLLGITRMEAHLANACLPTALACSVVGPIVESAFKAFFHQGQLLCEAISSRCSAHDFSALVFVFDTSMGVHRLVSSFGPILAECERSLFEQYKMVSLKLAEAGRRVLLEFLGHVSADPSTRLPVDGTVHEHTSTVLKFVDRAVEHSQSVGTVLGHEKTIAQHQTTLDWDDERTASVALANWILKVLDALEHNLDRKARAYETGNLQYLFLLNNFDFILRTVSASAYADILYEVGFDYKTRYRELLNHNKSLYFASTWGFVETVLSIPNLDKGVGPAERKKIKEKYTAFNEQFAAVRDQHHELTVPNPELRQELRQQTIQQVVPAFERFEQHCRLTDLQHPEKYLKYTPDDLENTICRFFGVAAATAAATESL